MGTEDHSEDGLNTHTTAMTMAIWLCRLLKKSTQVAPSTWDKCNESKSDGSLLTPRLFSVESSGETCRIVPLLQWVASSSHRDSVQR